MQAVEFTFSRDWTHAGTVYAKSDSVALSLAKAEKLKSLGAGTYTQPKSKPSAKIE